MQSFKGLLSILPSAAFLISAPQVIAQAQPNYALQFDGLDDVALGTASSQLFSYQGDFTVEFWIRIDSNEPCRIQLPMAGGFRFWYGQPCSGVSVQPSLGIWTAAGFPGPIGSPSNAPMPVQPSPTWHHVAYCKQGWTLRGYLDGSMVATFQMFPTPWLITFQNFSLGRVLGGGVAPEDGFDGAIDELRIWSTSRTAAEIAAGMGVQVPSNTPGLAAYWTFDVPLPTQVIQSLVPGRSITLGDSTQVTSRDPAFIPGAPIVRNPETDVRIAPGSLVAALAGTSSGPSTITAQLVNVGDLATTCRFDLFLGNPALPQSTLIATQVLTTAIGPGATRTVTASWTPPAPGDYTLFAQVATLSSTDQNPDDNSATCLLRTDPPPFEVSLLVDAATGWPSYAAAVGGSIENRGAQPITLTGLTYSPQGWLTLATPIQGQVLLPGATLPLQFALTVPPNVPGAPLGQPPLPQGIQIGVQATVGGLPVSAESSATFYLYNQPAANVVVRLLDRATNLPIANGSVTASSALGTFTTDNFGQALLPLSPGPVDIFAYKSGYIAAARTVDLPTGASVTDLALDPGATLGLQSVQTRILSATEVIERGVNVSDPANNHIVDFVVQMQIGGTIILRNQEVRRPETLSLAPGQSYTYTVNGYAYPSSATGGPGSGWFSSPGSPTSSVQHPSGTPVVGSVTYTSVPPVAGVAQPPVETQTWIVVPGTVTFLKEFFDVEVLVVNNATASQSNQIELRNVLAGIPSLPPGLVFPDLNGQAQQSIQTLQTPIGAGQSRLFHWVVRGDADGDYTLFAGSIGDLYAFGQPIAQLLAAGVSPSFEVTQPKVALTFDEPTQVQAGSPFDFKVRVRNQGIRPIQLTRVQIRADKLVNAGLDIAQPSNVNVELFSGTPISATANLEDIRPNASSVAAFRLVSQVAGRVLVSTPSTTPQVGVYELALVAAYGLGCPTGAGAVPLLTNTFPAVIGDDATFQINSPGTPGSLALVIRGYSDTFALGLGPLPLSMAPIGMPGCQLLSSLEATTLLPLDAAGQASFAEAVPYRLQLCGSEFFVQTLVLDPTANPGGIAASRGLRCTMGI